MSHGIFINQGREYSPMFGGNIFADLDNRDFTINALALDDAGHIYCHPKSLMDLQGKILRAVSEKIFLRDPVRILRLARFLAQDPTWQLADETLELVRKFPKELLANIAKERVAHELLRALGTSHPEQFFIFLAQFDLLKPWFGELDLAQGIPAGPKKWHSSDVFNHTMNVLKAVVGNPITCWMAICHDLGKINTPQEILPHHYQHEVRGVSLALDFSTRLGLPKRYEKAGVLAAAEHMRGGLYQNMRIGNRCDLLWLVKSKGLSAEFWQLVDADSQTDVSKKALADLEIISAVRLPAEFQNLGEKSREIFRQIQRQTLAHAERSKK